MTQRLPGVAPKAIEAWSAKLGYPLRPPLSFERIPGGLSNLTFGITDSAGRRFVLRRPPLGNVLAGAHDMEREARILAALEPTGVPVPTVIGVCSDPGVIGAPFYVMARIDGLILRDVHDARRYLTGEERATVGRELVKTLAVIHRVDPAGIGLDTLSRGDGYVSRQLRRWGTRWAESGGRDLPIVDEVRTLLAGTAPEQARVSITHGDYRLENVVIGEDFKVAGVLDWELCTLGDPLADLGLLLAYWSPGPLEEPATSAEGFPHEQEVVALYAKLTSLDVSRVNYYVAFSLWRLAVIMEGVVQRHKAGAYAGSGPKIEAMPVRVLRTLERARDLAEQAA